MEEIEQKSTEQEQEESSKENREEKQEVKSFADIAQSQNFQPVNLSADKLVLKSQESPAQQETIETAPQTIPQNEFREIKGSISDYVPRETTTDRRTQTADMSTDRRVQAHRENNYEAVMQAPVTLESGSSQRFENNRGSNLPMINNFGVNHNQSIDTTGFEKSQKQYEAEKHQTGPPHMSKSRRRDITKLF